MIITFLTDFMFDSTEKQLLTFYDTDGKLLSSMKLTEWYMSSRYPPLTATRFHPHKVLFATGAMDGLMAVYTIDPKKYWIFNKNIIHMYYAIKKKNSF